MLTSYVPAIYKFQEALRWGVETSLLPTFERLCQTMFNQVDVAMRDGINEYCGHTQLTQTLKVRWKVIILPKTGIVSKSSHLFRLSKVAAQYAGYRWFYVVHKR